MANKSKKHKSKQNKSKQKSKTDQYDHSPYLISLKESFRNAKRNPNDRPGFSPLSGSEPAYEPWKWNDRPRIKHTHNCYAYILNRILPQRMGKPQPGYFSNFPPLTLEDYKCDAFYKRLKKDIPSMYLTTFEERCKDGFYKAFLALAIAENGDNDYHFYREDGFGHFDENGRPVYGLWSHKPGRTSVSSKDSSGTFIKNPLISDRNYKSFNYNTPCFFFCLNPKLAKGHFLTEHK